MSIFESVVVSPEGIPEIEVRVAYAKKGEARLIDVREPDEFVGELGHIPGAELIPLGTLESKIAGWDKTAPLIMVCRSGNRSGKATAKLRALGFTTVVNMRGGMLAVQTTGLPVER